MDKDSLVVEGEITPIKRSPIGLQAQIIVGLLLVGTIGVLASWLFLTILDWTPNDGKLLVIITWAVLLLGWVGGSVFLWFDWRFKRYEIAKDALIVHARLGIWGSTQTLHRYDMIFKVHMVQGFLGRRFGYGDVQLSIPLVEHPIVLNDVEDPMHQMAQIQKRLGEHSSGNGVSAGVVEAMLH